MDNSKSLLGLPNFKNRGFFVGSTVFDSLASGVIFAFLLLYFNAVTTVGLELIGVSMSVGRAIALPSPWLAGKIMDSRGPIRTVLMGNLISVLGVVCAIFANDFIVICISQILIQTGTNFYWTSSRSVVSLAAAGDNLPKWFALLGALRNIGTGVGSICAALALQSNNALTLRVFVGFTAVFFLVASYLLVMWKNKRAVISEVSVTRKSRGGESGRKSRIIDNRKFVYLLLGNFFFVVIAMALPLMYPIWAINVLALPPVLTGIIVAINTALVALLSTVIVGKINHFKVSNILRWAGLVNIFAFALIFLKSESTEINLIVILVSVVLFSLAEIISTPFLSDLSVKLADADADGKYQGAFQLTWSIGMAVAPALYAFLFVQKTVVLAVSLLSISLIAALFASVAARQIKND